jgi:hypothetical protein
MKIAPVESEYFRVDAHTDRQDKANIHFLQF